QIEESLIVLGIPDPDRIVRREAQNAEGFAESRGFVDAGREDHYRALVEDNLQFQSHVADGVKDGGFVGNAARGDDMSTLEGWNTAVGEGLVKLLGRGFLERRPLL